MYLLSKIGNVASIAILITSLFGVSLTAQDVANTTTRRTRPPIAIRQLPQPTGDHVKFTSRISETSKTSSRRDSRIRDIPDDVAVRHVQYLEEPKQPASTSGILIPLSDKVQQLPTNHTADPMEKLRAQQQSVVAKPVLLPSISSLDQISFESNLSRQDDGLVRPQQSVDEFQEPSGELRIAKLQRQYALELRAPISMNPVQRSLQYVAQDGTTINPRFSNSYFNKRDPLPMQVTPQQIRVGQNGMPWNASLAAWRSPAIGYQPLYFEDASLERFGNEKMAQPICSAAHFFGSVVALPYKLGSQSPCRIQYDHGIGRAGNCHWRPTAPAGLNARGATFQGLITLALAYGIL